MPPIVSIVGKSNSGKTTLIEGLIKELKLRGYRIATVKHASRGLTLDKPGKDSWRHIHAGSSATAISSPGQLVLIKTVLQTPSLDEVAHFLEDDYDIILAEGFKHSNVPKIEVYHKEIGLPLSDIHELIAIATNVPIETTTKQFLLKDVRGLADFLENNFLKPSNKQTNGRSMQRGAVD
jgi:molybdopterin-guanine dinucleotide biosynthesis protein MobB